MKEGERDGDTHAGKSAGHGESEGIRKEEHKEVIERGIVTERERERDM